MSRKPVISVIGPNAENCTQEIYDFGIQLGKGIVDSDWQIVCGGRYGLMEAVCRGARESEKYYFGCTIGIIPSENVKEANPFCDTIIPTGIGIARNKIVVNTSDIVVAVAGGSGTLSEISFAWQSGKPIICCTRFEGWAKKLAGQQIDFSREGATIPAESTEEILIEIDRISGLRNEINCTE